LIVSIGEAILFGFSIFQKATANAIRAEGANSGAERRAAAAVQPVRRMVAAWISCDLSDTRRLGTHAHTPTARIFDADQNEYPIRRA
jgi:hypothetical protein